MVKTEVGFRTPGNCGWSQQDGLLQECVLKYYSLASLDKALALLDRDYLLGSSPQLWAGFRPFYSPQADFVYQGLPPYEKCTQDDCLSFSAAFLFPSSRLLRFLKMYYFLASSTMLIRSFFVSAILKVKKKMFAFFLILFCFAFHSQCKSQSNYLVNWITRNKCLFHLKC